MDILDQAEELNQVSALYNVEIDGVPLQQMSTNELSKVSEGQLGKWELHDPFPPGDSEHVAGARQRQTLATPEPKKKK